MADPSRAELRAHLDLGSTKLNDLFASGVLSKSGTLDECRVAYIRHLRERAAGRETDDGLNLVESRARLANEQADKLAMENAETRGELARWEDVEAFVVPLLSSVVQRLLAVPSKVAPEAHGSQSIAECEAAIRGQQEDALSDIVAALSENAARVRSEVERSRAERRGRSRRRSASAQSPISA